MEEWCAWSKGSSCLRPHPQRSVPQWNEVQLSLALDRHFSNSEHATAHSTQHQGHLPGLHFPAELGLGKCLKCLLSVVIPRPNHQVSRNGNCGCTVHHREIGSEPRWRLLPKVAGARDGSCPPQARLCGRRFRLLSQGLAPSEPHGEVGPQS